MKRAYRDRVLAEHRVGNLSRAGKDIAYVLSGYPSHSFCWPSHATLANRAACSVRTVQRQLEQMKMLGLVDWSHRYRPGRGRGHRASNVYRLAVPVEAVRALQPVQPSLRQTGKQPLSEIHLQEAGSGSGSGHGSGCKRAGDQVMHTIFASYTGRGVRGMDRQILEGRKRPTGGAGWRGWPAPQAPIRTVEEQIRLLGLPFSASHQPASSPA
ncbi:MAG: hypothetical protein ACRYG8_43960 [Janthinobacterium lividum]